MSAGAIERDFTAAGRALSSLRGNMMPRYFQAQLLCYLNRGLITLSKMSPKDMAIRQVHNKLPKDGFVKSNGTDADDTDVSDEEDSNIPTVVLD